MGAAWPNARPSRGPPPGQAGALVSLRTGKVLREYSVIGGGVPDGRGGWVVVSGTMEIRRMRHDGSIRTDWHSRPTGRRVPAIGEIVRVGGRLFVEDGYPGYAIPPPPGKRS